MREKVSRPVGHGAVWTILVLGAGVIGTLYAARLQQAGHRVTVLARGERLAEIQRDGLVLEDVVSGVRSVIRVDTTERLDPNDIYDVVLVAVRRDQLASAMPQLVASRGVSTVLFMLNNPTGSVGLVQALGPERVVLGFPGAGGTREDHAVRFAMIAQQPTTLGEPGGRNTPRLRALAEVFASAGFPTRTSRDMDAWLKTHAVFVTAMSGAIYLAGGDCRGLAESSATLNLMVRAVREGFGALGALGLRVTPFPLRVLFTWLPAAFAVAYWRRFLSSPMADYVFGRHARSAAAEMRELAEDCETLLDRAGAEAPALRRLYRAIEAYGATPRVAS